MATWARAKWEILYQGSYRCYNIANVSSKLKINMISESAFTVQGHGVHTSFLEMSKALNARDDVDIVINKFRRKPDITHIHTLGLYALAHLLFWPGKKVVSVHVVPDSFVGSIKGAERLYGFARWYLRFFYSRADLLLAVSEMVKDVVENDLKVSRPMQVLYNTVDMSGYRVSGTQRQASRQKLGVKPDQFVIISSGQIQPRKRFDVFCKLAKGLPDFKFFWVGGIPFKQLGAEYQAMEGLMTNAPANLEITGVIGHDQVLQYLHAADAFILPSEQENHPMAVLEAAGASLPLVVRDIKEYDDTFGQDVLRGTDETFEEILVKLKNDPNFYKKAVDGAKAIASRYDSTAGTAKMIEFYRGLVGRS